MTQAVHVSRRAGALLRLALAGVVLLAAAACEKSPETPVAPKLVLTPADYAALPGWSRDEQAAALPALRASCNVLARRAPREPVGAIGGTAGDWQVPCAGLANLPQGDSAALRSYLEAHFTPYAVSDGEAREGLFTGYFEPILSGARNRSDRFGVPIYALPRDHVSVRLGDFDPSLAGKQLVGRVEGGRLVPYHPRGAIDSGALADTASVLYWADDPLDVFILQVQGSGIVALPDGSQQRIGFAGHNGHGYASIGRALIEAGELESGRAGWPDIRAWLEAHPDRAAETLAVNRRFIFFREIEGDGPIGAAGIALTAGRSMAVDPDFIPLGVPLWLDAESPAGKDLRLQRLMVAQDTGSAIRGVVRGDFYWGTGREALAMAGRMKSSGRYYVLLPRTLTPAS